MSRRARLPATDTPAAEWVDIASIKPNKRNLRKHPDEQVLGIASTIQAYGFGRPLLVRVANREIIAGHGAYLAAQKLGMTKVPCRMLDVSASHAKQLAIADNRWAELSSWDTPALAIELGALSEADQVLAGFKRWEPDKSPGEKDTSPQLGCLEFKVIVDCSTEAHQLETLARFESEGFVCRPLIS